MRRWLAASLMVCAASVSRCDAKPTGRVCTISPQTADFRLVASGTEFHDSLGRVVVLRGVDAGGRSKFAPYVPFDFGTDFDGALAKYMDRAASWGIDVMRVPFTWAALEPTQGQDDATWLAHYDAIIDAAWARGIWSVIDFHQDVYAEEFCGDGFPGWTLTSPPAPHHDCPQWSFEYFSDDAVKAAFDAFWAPALAVMTAYLAAWDRMVARYKDKPGVLGFEPINEPGWGTADPKRVQRDDPQRLLHADGRAHARARAGVARLRRSGRARWRLADDVAHAPARRRRRLRAALLSAHEQPRRAARRHDASGATSARRGTRPCSSASSARATISSRRPPLMQARLRLARRARHERLRVGIQRRHRAVEQRNRQRRRRRRHRVSRRAGRRSARSRAPSRARRSPAASTRDVDLHARVSHPPPRHRRLVSLRARIRTATTSRSTAAATTSTSVPGQMLVQPDAGATKVTLLITPR